MTVKTLFESARIFSLTSLASLVVACGGGVPIELRIDEFAMELDLDAARQDMQEQLVSMGTLPPGTSSLPEIWPESLPDIRYPLLIATPPAPVDLTPDPDSEDADKYEDINKAQEVVTRIEINRLVLRVEQNTMTVGLPELALRVADEPNAIAEDSRAWLTVGKMPATAPGFVGDVELQWVTGGESFLNAQLGDEEKELAIRALGSLVFDTEENPALPRGKAKLRLIVVATFYVEPQGAL